VLENIMETRLPTFEMPEELRGFTARSINQGRKLSDDFFSAAKSSTASLNGVASVPGAPSVKDIICKYLDYAQQNANAGFDHATRLIRAKDLSEAMRMQTEFMQNQFSAVQEQLLQNGAAAQQAASGVGTKRKS
jgi:phasin